MPSTACAGGALCKPNDARQSEEAEAEAEAEGGDDEGAEGWWCVARSGAGPPGNTLADDADTATGPPPAPMLERRAARGESPAERAAAPSNSCLCRSISAATSASNDDAPTGSLGSMRGPAGPPNPAAVRGATSKRVSARPNTSAGGPRVTRGAAMPDGRVCKPCTRKHREPRPQTKKQKAKRVRSQEQRCVVRV